jgi:hypothetical protein
MCTCKNEISAEKIKKEKSKIENLKNNFIRMKLN